MAFNSEYDKHLIAPLRPDYRHMRMFLYVLSHDFKYVFLGSNVKRRYGANVKHEFLSIKLVGMIKTRRKCQRICIII